MRHAFGGLSRRDFLAHAGAVAVGAAVPALASLRVSAAPAADSPRLVVVILRGALDGLAAVPPHGDPAYAELRRDLAISPPNTGDGALPLDGLFGLHPSFTFAHQRYLDRQLILFHAAASPYRERSHFDGQNVLENGLIHPSGSADGWLNRALAALPPRRAGPAAERAVAIGQSPPLLLRGPSPVLSRSPVHTADVDDDLLARLADLYSTDDWFAARFAEAMEGRGLSVDDSAVGMGMAGKTAGSERVVGVARLAGQLMRDDAGPQIAVIEATGWDTHANQGGAKGLLATRLAGLDDALRSLSEELGPRWSRTAVLVVTEFGRTAAVNGTRGTDHGTAGCALLLGGAVQGGRVIADWPGLSRAALLDARDLRPTLDLRSVFKSVLGDHLHADARSLSSRIFPDSGGAPALQGLIRA